MIRAAVAKVFAVPAVYRAWGIGVGAVRGRDIFVREHVRPEEGDKILDIGCGPADIVPHLGRIDYTGFDANPEYIATATKNYGSDRVTFHCGRVAEENVGDHAGCNIVLASGILHHLDDAEAEQLCRIARAALAPGGRLVTLDCVYADDQSRAARFIISRDRGEHVRDEKGYVDIVKRVFPNVKATVRSDILRIPYTHLILECSAAS